MEKISSECLISAVQSRPVLWQVSHKDYKNKNVTDKQWNEVGKICNCSGATAKAKWKNLKDSFRRTLQKISRATSESEAQPIKAKWQFFEMMSFIKQTVVPDPNEGNLWEPEEYLFAQGSNYSNNIKVDLLSEEETVLTNVNMPSTSTPSTSCSYNLQKNKRKKAKTINLDAEFLELERERINILKQQTEKKEDNDDMQFFKSLLPFMAKFNDLEKLEIRGGIQNIILEKLKKKKKE